MFIRLLALATLLSTGANASGSPGVRALTQTNHQECNAKAFEGVYEYLSQGSGLKYTVIINCNHDGTKCQRTESTEGVEVPGGRNCAYVAFFNNRDVEIKDGKCTIGPSRDSKNKPSWPKWYDPTDENNLYYAADYLKPGGGKGPQYFYIPLVTIPPTGCDFASISGEYGYGEILDKDGNLETFYTGNFGQDYEGFGPPVNMPVARFSIRISK